MLQSTFEFDDHDTGKVVRVAGYYHDEYYGMSSPNNRIRFVNVLKNDRCNTPSEVICQNEKLLAAAIRGDLARITQKHGRLTLCGVPRSKRENSYPWSKMGLKRALRQAATENPLLDDGMDFIVRHTDTRCTHRDRWGYGGAGELPRPGLIQDTCHLSAEIAGKDVLLVDDIYTPNCGIDEDAICAVMNAGAKRVVFYAIGYTVGRTGAYRRCA